MSGDFLINGFIALSIILLVLLFSIQFWDSRKK